MVQLRRNSLSNVLHFLHRVFDILRNGAQRVIRILVLLAALSHSLVPRLSVTQLLADARETLLTEFLHNTTTTKQYAACILTQSLLLVTSIAAIANLRYTHEKQRTPSFTREEWICVGLSSLLRQVNIVFGTNEHAEVRSSSSPCTSQSQYPSLILSSLSSIVSPAEFTQRTSREIHSTITTMNENDSNEEYIAGKAEYERRVSLEWIE